MGAGVYGGAAWIVLEQQRKERERVENKNRHDSDCAIYNEPAYPNGPCDCSIKEKDRK